MTLLTVTKIDTSKNGKARVYFGNNHGWKDAYYVSQKIASPAVGQSIDAVTSSKDFNGDGKLTWFLNEWKPATQTVPVELAVAATPSTGKPGLADQTAYKPPKGWNIDYGDLSRFTSNVVGNAITAGLIKEPGDMAPWIASAYRALEAVRTGEILDFDDDLPDLSGGLADEDRGDPADRQAGEDDEFESDSAIPF